MTIYELLTNISRGIKRLWGTSEFNDYIDNLVSGSHPYAIQPLGKEIISTLLSIKIKHDEEFPELKDIYRSTLGFSAVRR